MNLPGEGTKKYLPAGLTLTPEQKLSAENRKTMLAEVLGVDRAQKKPRLGLIAKMLLTYPITNGNSEASGAARAEAYLDALDDIPPWILDKAIRGWNRGEVGEHNYSFAPGPAVLRGVCKRLLAPYQRQLDEVTALLDAKPLADLLSSERRADPKVVEGFDALSKSLGSSLDVKRAANPEIAKIAAAARDRQPAPQEAATDGE